MPDGINTAALIQYVRPHVFLYDVKNKDHYNKAVMDSKWMEISNQLGASVKECRTRWRSLKDRYNKERREYETMCALKPDDDSLHYPKWQYFQPLSFLSKHLKHRRCRTMPNDVIHDSGKPFIFDQESDQERSRMSIQHTDVGRAIKVLIDGSEDIAAFNNSTPLTPPESCSQVDGIEEIISNPSDDHSLMCRAFPTRRMITIKRRIPKRSCPIERKTTKKNQAISNPLTSCENPTNPTCVALAENVQRIADKLSEPSPSPSKFAMYGNIVAAQLEYFGEPQAFCVFNKICSLIRDEMQNKNAQS